MIKHILSSDLVGAVQLILVVVVRGIEGLHQKHVTLAAQ
jgi:hypothetical protein